MCKYVVLTGLFAAAAFADAIVEGSVTCSEPNLTVTNSQVCSLDNGLIGADIGTGYYGSSISGNQLSAFLRPFANDVSMIQGTSYATATAKYTVTFPAIAAGDILHVHFFQQDGGGFDMPGDPSLKFGGTYLLPYALTS